MTPVYMVYYVNVFRKEPDMYLGPAQESEPVTRQMYNIKPPLPVDTSHLASCFMVSDVIIVFTTVMITIYKYFCKLVLSYTISPLLRSWLQYTCT